MSRRFSVASLVFAVMGVIAVQAAATRVPNPPKELCIGTQCVTTPASGGKIKWNPGHYMAAEGILKAGKTLADVQSEMDDINGWDQILGYRLVTTWGALEPSQGQYDFTVLDSIFNRLKTAYNKPKRLVLVVLPGSFSGSLGSNDGSMIPTYIQHDPKYGPSPVAGSYGWWGSGSSYVAALYRPAVLTRFNALIQAIAARYDNDPYFEGFMVQENSWMVGTWKTAPDFDWNSDAPFPALLGYAVSVFPHTNVALQNTYLLRQGPTVELSEWMFANRVLTASSDTVGQSAFDQYGFHLSWGLAAYAGIATGNLTPVDQRPKAPTMMDIESPDMYGGYFAKYGGPFAPLDIVTALNQTYQASHAYWVHFFGTEYHGGVPAAARWKALASTVSAHPLTNTSYPANYPK